MTSALTTAVLHVLKHTTHSEHILSDRDLLTAFHSGQDLLPRGFQCGSLHNRPFLNAHLSEPIPALRPFQSFERMLPLEHTLPFQTGLVPGKSRYWKRSPELPTGSMLKGFHRLPKAPPKVSPRAPVSLVWVECPWAPVGLTRNTTPCKIRAYRGAVASTAIWLTQTTPRHGQSTSNHTPVAAVGNQLQYTGCTPVPSGSRGAQNPGVAAARRCHSGKP